jgi:hypothetical protein
MTSTGPAVSVGVDSYGVPTVHDESTMTVIIKLTERRTGKINTSYFLVTGMVLEIRVLRSTHRLAPSSRCGIPLIRVRANHMKKEALVIVCINPAHRVCHSRSERDLNDVKKGRVTTEDRCQL